MMFRSFALLGALMGSVYCATIDNTDEASTLQASAQTGPPAQAARYAVRS